MHEVTDKFSKMMLETVPRKVVNWLLLLGQDLGDEFKYGDLSLYVTPEGGRMIVEDFTIHWTGTVSNIESIDVSDPELLDLSAPFMLDYFVGVEETIYGILSSLHQEIQDLEAPRVKVDQSTLKR